MTPERVTTSWRREGEMFAGSACGVVCEVVEDRDEGRRKFVVNMSQCVAKMRSRGVTVDTHRLTIPSILVVTGTAARLSSHPV